MTQTTEFTSRPAAGSRRPAIAPVLSAALAALLAQPGAAALPSPVPSMDHVIVVVMENQSYDRSRALPYTASLIAQYSSFSDSWAVAHPSQPNYLALWAGSTLGVGDNRCPPDGSPFEVENFGHACEQAGLTWKAYSENLPEAGSPVCRAADGLYTRRHDPWTQFANLSHPNEVPYSRLAADIAAGTLPNLSFVIPNNCHNTHDCSIHAGDAWLLDQLPGMISAVGPRGLVVLTWDESERSGKNHILTVFAGPLVKAGYVSTRRIDHYSVVRTVCDALSLPSFGFALSDSAVSDVWATPTVQSVPADPGARIRLGVGGRLDFPRGTAGEAEVERKLARVR